MCHFLCQSTGRARRIVPGCLGAPDSARRCEFGTAGLPLVMRDLDMIQQLRKTHIWIESGRVGQEDVSKIIISEHRPNSHMLLTTCLKSLSILTFFKATSTTTTHHDTAQRLICGLSLSRVQAPTLQGYQPVRLRLKIVEIGMVSTILGSQPTGSCAKASPNDWRYFVCQELNSLCLERNTYSR
jgi:hypothetical protein